jgi:TPR repeat protein
LAIYFLSSAEDPKLAEAMLVYSASLGFVPAMRILSDSLLTTDGRREEGLAILETAGEFYRDPLSLYKLGILYLYTHDQKERALAYLKQAALLGHRDAHVRAGIVLSPLSSFVDFQPKNAAEAMKHFQAAVAAGDRSAAVLHEMAKLLKQGLGCKKDERAAQLCQSRAKALSPAIPALDEKQPEERPWLLAGLSVVALSIFGIALVRHLRR